ncbi:MAG: hypothetical protein HS115_00755 [Spirochaetales bacterium]|nr:hypothetical protein [Spirochaetales bacterium]
MNRTRALWPEPGLAALAWILSGVVLLTQVHSHLLWNSDALFGESLARAVFSGKSLAPFFFPPPGFFFPDLSVYLAFRLTIPDFRLALSFHLVFQYLVLFFCLLVFQKTLGRPVLSLAFVPIGLLFCFSWFPEAQALLLPLHHGIQAGLTLFLLSSVLGSKPDYLFLYLIIVPALASDPLLITWLLIPGLLLLLQSRAPLRFWMVAVVLAALLRYGLKRFFYLPDPFAGYLTTGFFLSRPHLALFCLFMLPVFLLILWRTFHLISRISISRRLRVLLAIVSGQFISVLFFILNNQEVSLRYVLPLVLLFILLASELLLWLWKRNRLVALVITGLILGDHLMHRQQKSEGDWSACLEALAGKKTSGMADSFKARPFSLHSGQLFVQVDGALRPHVWMNSYEDYYDFLRAPTQEVFVVREGLEGPSLDQLPRPGTISCSAGSLYIVRSDHARFWTTEELDLWRKLTGR